MKKYLSIILALILVLSCFGTAFAETEAEKTTGANKTSFSDVTGTALETAVNNLVSMGIINGYTEENESLFKPLNAVTRAEACKIVVMSTNPKEAQLSDTSSAFGDMSGYAWANAYINYAVSKGIITGYEDKTFRPGANVSYNEMNAMIVRALGIKEDTLTGTWPANFANKATELGIHKGLMNAEGTAGITGEYGSDNAIRGNVAIMINNVIDELQKVNSESSDNSNNNQDKDNNGDKDDQNSNSSNTSTALSDYTGRAYAVINGTSTFVNKDKEKVGQLEVQYGEATLNLEMESKLDTPAESDFLTASLFCMTMDDGVIEEYTKDVKEIQAKNSYFKVLAGNNESASAGDFATITSRSDSLVHYTEAGSTEDKSFVIYDEANFYVCSFDDGTIDGYESGRISDIRPGALMKAYTINKDGDETAQVVIIVDKNDTQYIK